MPYLDNLPGLLKNTDILVLDDEDKLIMEENQIGELCVRGSSLALGYYNDTEKTALAFTQNPLNKAYPEKIYRTGDIVYYNEKGELNITKIIDELETSRATVMTVLNGE